MLAAKRILILLGLLFAPAAWAHSPIEGVEGFYSGLLHPVLVPAHLLALVVLGLWCGQRGPRAVRACLITLFVTLLLSLAATFWGFALGGELGLLVLVTFIGLLVAWQKSWPIFVYVLAGFLVALLLGFDSAADTVTGTRQFIVLTGVCLGACLCFIYTAGLAGYLQQSWQRVGIRVVAAWIVASALMALALALISRQ